MPLWTGLPRRRPTPLTSGRVPRAEADPHRRRHHPVRRRRRVRPRHRLRARGPGLRHRLRAGDPRAGGDRVRQRAAPVPDRRGVRQRRAALVGRVHLPGPVRLQARRRAADGGPRGLRGRAGGAPPAAVGGRAGRPGGDLRARRRRGHADRAAVRRRGGPGVAGAEVGAAAPGRARGEGPLGAQRGVVAEPALRPRRPPQRGALRRAAGALRGLPRGQRRAELLVRRRLGAAGAAGGVRSRAVAGPEAGGGRRRRPADHPRRAGPGRRAGGARGRRPHRGRGRPAHAGGGGAGRRRPRAGRVGAADRRPAARRGPAARGGRRPRGARPGRRAGARPAAAGPAQRREAGGPRAGAGAGRRPRPLPERASTRRCAARCRCARSDASVELPEIAPPKLGLSVEHLPGHRARLAWSVLYRAGEEVRRVPLARGTGVVPDAGRDLDTEDRLLRALPAAAGPAAAAVAPRPAAADRDRGGVRDGHRRPRHRVPAAAGRRRRARSR